jgi:raffinose/stachyose/melibiose transport system substrate-binding protein
MSVHDYPRHTLAVRLGCAFGALAAAAGLTACGSSSASGGNGSSNTLVIQSLSFEGPQTEAVVKAFEAANPNVKVTVESITASQLDTNGNVMSSTDPPDVGFVDINRPDYTQLTGAHDLVPLGDVWQAENLRTRYGASLSAALSNGGSSPYVVAVDGIYYSALTYNTKLFAQLGIPAPQNHRFSSVQQLNAAVAKLTAHGYAGIAIGGDTTYTVSNLIDPFLPTSASDSQLTNYLTNWNPKIAVTASYTDPAFVDVLNQLQSMNSKHYFQNGFLGQTPTQASSVFASGKAGMYLSGNFDVATFDQSMKGGVNWALFPPLSSSKTPQLDIFVDSMGIPAHAHNPGLAKKFLEFYVTAQAQALVLNAGVNLPVVNDLPASAKASDPLVNEMVADAQKNGTQMGWTSTVPAALGQGFTNPLIEKMFLGETNPTAIASQTQAALSSVRSGQ